MPATSRVLALCADDFGLSESISAAIIALVQKQRLTSVSCITNAANFVAAAQSLQPLHSQVEVGLHFNLTEGQPMSTALAAYWPELPSVGHLILRSHLHAIPRAAIEQELHAQWQAFYAAFGKTPDFIDGHQHVHDLPGIRDAVLAKAHTQNNAPWIRNTGSIRGNRYAFKRRVIEFTGGRTLQRQLRQQKLRSNAVLLGVYDFTPRDYRALMQSWLTRLPATGGLIFCHPGLLAATGNHSTMAHCRAAEHRYFASDDFTKDMHAAHVRLQPLSRQAREPWHSMR